MGNDHLKISELAARSGISARTIRFYEHAGVLPPPERAPNGYRLYTADKVELLRFVKQAQGLGLTLGGIKEIIAIRRGGRPPCQHVYRLLQAKAAELDQKLRDLVVLRRRIRQSLTAWGRRPAGGAAVCPHIEASSGQARPRRSRKA